MQRAAFPELQGRPRPRRHRRPARPDRVLLGLKVGTFLAAGGLIGVIILWAGGGGGDGRNTARQQAPAVPQIVPSQPPDDTSTTEPPPTVIVPPALRTETSHIAGQPPPPPNPAPKPTPTSTVAPVPPDPGFAVIGEPCPQPGMFWITRDDRAVACYSDPPEAPPRWHPLF